MFLLWHARLLIDTKFIKLGVQNQGITSLDSALVHSEEAIQVLAQSCHILEAYQNEFQKISNHATLVDLMLLNAKEVLSKVQQLHFIESPLRADLEKLGISLSAFRDGNALLTLNECKIPLEDERIKVCLDLLPLSIQYIPSCKELLFKLNFLPKGGIAWLEIFRDLLMNLKQSTEKALIQDFSSLTIKATSLEPKEKIKTRPQKVVNEADSGSGREEKNDDFKPVPGYLPRAAICNEEENYGFKLEPKYSPAVPILCKNNYIPMGTLFISLPTKDPAFVPFLNLIRDKESGTYHGIYMIASKGCNQQGVKFVKKRISQLHQPSVTQEFVRVKVLGTAKGGLRAIGGPHEQKTTPDGRTQTLYRIDKIESKKSEKRKNLL